MALRKPDHAQSVVITNAGDGYKPGDGTLYVWSRSPGQVIDASGSGYAAAPVVLIALSGGGAPQDEPDLLAMTREIARGG